MSEAATSSGANKMAERMKRLRALHAKRVSIVDKWLKSSGIFIHLRPFCTRISQLISCSPLPLLLQTEASKLNHKEVVEENKRQQLPTNWQKRQELAQTRL